MRKAKLLTLTGAMCLMVSGCGVGTGNSGEGANISLNDYSLTGSDLEQSGTGTDGSENAYVIYTDGTYDYYFYESMSLRSISSIDMDLVPAKADTDVLVEQALAYMKQINALDDVSNEDWVVDEPSEGTYIIYLSQTDSDESLAAASFYFSGDKLYSVTFNTDV